MGSSQLFVADGPGQQPRPFCFCAAQSQRKCQSVGLIPSRFGNSPIAGTDPFTVTKMSVCNPFGLVYRQSAGIGVSPLVLGCPPRWMTCCKRNGPKSPAFVVKPRAVGCSVLEQPINSDSSKTVASAFKCVLLPNVPDQRPRASDVRFETEAPSRGSLHPACWALSFLSGNQLCDCPRHMLLRKLGKARVQVAVILALPQQNPCMVALNNREVIVRFNVAR